MKTKKRTIILSCLIIFAITSIITGLCEVITTSSITYEALQYGIAATLAYLLFCFIFTRRRINLTCLVLLMCVIPLATYNFKGVINSIINTSCETTLPWIYVAIVWIIADLQFPRSATEY